MKKKYEVGGLISATTSELLVLIGIVVAVVLAAILGFAIFIGWIYTLGAIF